MKKQTVDLSGFKILVVDDVPTNLDVLDEILEEANYSVMVATDGTTALEVVQESRPDAILLDVMMPGIDGFETCRRLKADPAVEDVPVIFLTARDDIEGLIEGFQAGGVDYLTKPFKKEELLVRVRTHLERAYFERGLEELNAHLEDKVAERTRQLQLKVQELQGKDRILRHMLSFQSLEAALELVLEVVVDTVDLERAAVYLKKDEALEATAAIGYFAPGEQASAEQLGQLAVTPDQERAFARAAESKQSVRRGGEDEGATATAAIPVCRGNVVLGFIEVTRGAGAPLSDDELLTLESFALQATMAINDALIRQDPNAWQAQLDEVLELDEELDDDDLFDQLRRRIDL